MQLDDVIETVKNDMKQIDEDERFHYEPANVFINAPLALQQVSMKSAYGAYEKVLFLLQKVKKPDESKAISILKRYQNSLASSRERCDEDERELWDRIDEAIREAQDE